MSRRLPRKFYNQPVVTVAQQLLGKILVVGEHRGIITETEAYHQHDDPACHAFRGKTPRNAVMFGPPGFSYVYFIYGMYYCLNVVTEPESIAAAVLIRGVQTEQHHYNGPGKLCKAFGITRELHNGIDLVKSNDFYILDNDIQNSFEKTPRIGIKNGLDKLWRFVLKN